MQASPAVPVSSSDVLGACPQSSFSYLVLYIHISSPASWTIHSLTSETSSKKKNLCESSGFVRKWQQFFMAVDAPPGTSNLATHWNHLESFKNDWHIVPISRGSGLTGLECVLSPRTLLAPLVVKLCSQDWEFFVLEWTVTVSDDKIFPNTCKYLQMFLLFWTLF